MHLLLPYLSFQEMEAAEAEEVEEEVEEELEEEAPQPHPLRLHPVLGLQEEEEVVVEVADHPLRHLLRHLPHQQQPQILQMTS